VRGTTTGLSNGANAEYVCVPESPKKGVIIKKAPEISHEEAAVSIVGPMTAIQLLNRASLKKGDSGLIYGASGSVGSFALQIARYQGAAADGVCSSTNRDLVASLGALNVFDYRSDDFLSSGKKYDVILDAVGKLGKTRSAKALVEGGRYVSVRSMTKEVREELEYIQELQIKGALKPLIDSVFSLEQIKEAHHLVDSGRKKGNVVIAIGGS